MKVLKKELTLQDVASAIEHAMISLGFNADVERVDNHSFDVRVATEDKESVILVSGVMGEGRC